MKEFNGKKGPEKPIIKATTPTSKKYDTKVDIYTQDPKQPHQSIHIAINTEQKTAHIIDTTSPKENGKAEHTDIKCYLTTACMRHYNEDFDDNCEELKILRWFRDNFVSKEDIEMYYMLAPGIIEGINKLDKKIEQEKIYAYIYNSIAKYCVDAIKEKQYEKAYGRYMAAVMSLEDQFSSTKYYQDEKIIN